MNNITSRWVWDGTRLVKDGDTNYYYGLSLISSSAGNYYVLNGHGDVAALTNEEGEKVRAYSYSAFGIEENPDWDDENPFRYCGEYYDKGIGAIYLRARTYDPSTGRFTTEDPAKDGLNWYVYCYNNPVRFIDSNGMVAYEHFDSPDEAAKDWAWNYHEITQYSHHEVGSLMYTGRDENGNIYYAYTYAIVDDYHSISSIGDAAEFLPEGVTIYGPIHTHTDFKSMVWGEKGLPITAEEKARGQFSKADYVYAKQQNKPIYVVAPTYWNFDQVVIQRMDVKRDGSFSVSTISNRQNVMQLPNKKKQELNDRFYKDWYEHALTGCEHCFDKI